MRSCEPVDRNVEDGGDFGLLDPECRAGREAADEGADRVVAGQRLDHRQGGKDVHGGGVDTQFLARFAQSGGAEVDVARLRAPTGEGDLTGMVDGGGAADE